MSRSERGGSIDEEAGRGDGADEVSTRGASPDISDLSDGCATAGTCTLRE